MRMTAVWAQMERKPQDRSVRRAEKRSRLAGMLRLRGPIRPVTGVCATTDADRSKKIVQPAYSAYLGVRRYAALGETASSLPANAISLEAQCGI